MHWRITLNGTDISSKVSSFEVACEATSYCRQLTMAISDPALYSSFDFLTLPEAPAVAVYVYAGQASKPVFPDDYTKLGSFFVERPATRHDPNRSAIDEVWGRSKNALLGPPFAVKITKTWTEDTTFYAICAEMCAACGITWDPDFCRVDDYQIFAWTYRVEGVYPIDVITELAQLAAGSDVLVTTDGDDHLAILPVVYDTAGIEAAFEITEPAIDSLSEDISWPDFGNRVRITSTGNVGGYTIRLSIPDQCLSANGTARAVMYAQVVDPDGAAVDHVPVDWTVSRNLVTLAAATTNTRTMTITEEAQRAKSYYEVDVTFPPKTVTGVWIARDAARENNLIADGYELDGNTIILPHKLTYCDQSLVITYSSEGIAVNYATAGTTPGTEKVTADLAGNDDTQELYIDNPCACPPRISLKANPATINVGEVSLILAYLEIAGSPVEDGRLVWMTVDSEPGHGQLDWASASLAKVNVLNERTSVRNVIAGVSQCELEMFPATVSSVKQCDDDGNPIGAELYESHVGKTVTLNTLLSSDTELVASYSALGARVNVYTGQSVGEDRLRAFIASTREERSEATCRIQVKTPDEPPIEPPDCCDPPIEPPIEPPIDPPWPPEKPKIMCRMADGSIITCGSGKVCCEKGGVKGCWPRAECDGPPIDPCYGTNCHETPTDECFAARFAKPLDEGCSCEDICWNEIKKFGTTQAYDGGSYRTIERIVIDDYGLEKGSAAYWEKYGELETGALTLCRDECGECEDVSALVLTGSTGVTGPGGYAYGVSGGKPPYTWSVTGTGASIIDGFLTLTGEACGTGTVTVTDACGQSASMDYGVNNNGEWVTVYDCSTDFGPGSGGTCYETTDTYMAVNDYCTGPQCGQPQPQGCGTKCSCVPGAPVCFSHDPDLNFCGCPEGAFYAVWGCSS